MRFLCLHGLGTSSDVLKAQTASLRYRLGQDADEFDFVDGSILWPPARGIAELFNGEADSVDCYSYFHESATSILTAVNDLAAYVITNGPFDGVVGFSQGAVLAATLLIAVQPSSPETTMQSADADTESALPDALRALQTRGEPPFRFAVFLCGGRPFDLRALQRGVIVEIMERPSPGTPLINLPVVNCWAGNDEDYPGMGPPLSSLCGINNVEVVHGAGHGVPSEGKDLDALCRAVEKIIGICGDTRAQ
ncbi:serine hydrolase FSH [Aspergillus pseudodeflectus]|uniref:Serine hydrolase FSH n=1 Tax=Aspergillus pseudodeflectus TaxID=176178 RepID=A0ABR4K0L1_9EURO